MERSLIGDDDDNSMSTYYTHYCSLSDRNNINQFVCVTSTACVSCVQVTSRPIEMSSGLFTWSELNVNRRTPEMDRGLNRWIIRVFACFFGLNSIRHLIHVVIWRFARISHWIRIEWKKRRWFDANCFRPSTNDENEIKKPWTLAFSDSKSMIWWRHSKCANHILLSLLGLVVRKLNDNLSDNWTELTGSGTCEMIRSLWDVVCHWIDHLLR